MPLAQFEFVISVNLIGTFNCIRLGAASIAKTDPLDSDGQRGAIVNMASVAALMGKQVKTPIQPQRRSCRMTLPIARDLVPLGIRINTIAPGLIDTPIYGEEKRRTNLKRISGKAFYFPRDSGTPTNSHQWSLNV